MRLLGEMDAPLKVELPGQSLESSAVLKQELAVLESKYEVLALENARLARENMMMQHTHLAQENMLLRMQSESLPSPMIAAQQWWSSMNVMSNSPQARCSSAYPKTSHKSTPKAPRQRKTDADGDDSLNSCFKHERVKSSADSSFSTASTSAGNSPFSSFEESAESESKDGAASEVLTTVMMRNVPNNMTRNMLLDILNAQGFAGLYDFVYLPMDFKNMVGLGYSFVNLVDSEAAKRFHAHFSSFQNWGLQSDKVCEVTWSDTLQGRDAHVERYRNSPVMHESMPDECKPLIFQDGERMPFPWPTRRIRAPRQWTQRR